MNTNQLDETHSTQVSEAINGASSLPSPSPLPVPRMLLPAPPHELLTNIIEMIIPEPVPLSPQIVPPPRHYTNPDERLEPDTLPLNLFTPNLDPLTILPRSPILQTDALQIQQPKTPSRQSENSITASPPITIELLSFTDSSPTEDPPTSPDAVPKIPNLRTRALRHPQDTSTIRAPALDEIPDPGNKRPRSANNVFTSFVVNLNGITRRGRIRALGFTAWEEEETAEWSCTHERKSDGYEVSLCHSF